MKVSELEEELENLDIDKKARKAFLKIIDLKIESDMDKMISEMKSFRSELNTKLESSIGSLKSENKIIYWVVGSAFAVITVLLGILALKK